MEKRRAEKLFKEPRELYDGERLAGAIEPGRSGAANAASGVANPFAGLQSLFPSSNRHGRLVEALIATGVARKQRLLVGAPLEIERAIRAIHFHQNCGNDDNCNAVQSSYLFAT